MKRDGWAIECRINAEDPFRNFMPSTGRLVRYLPPPTTMEAAQPMPAGGGVRVDTGVYEGGEIPMYYDSMIAKLIVHGRDRTEAIERMREALNGFVIRGVSSNIPFQAALLAHPKFVAGDFNTGFIAEHYAHGFRAQDVPHDDPDFLVALAAAAYRRYRERASRITGQLPGYEMKIGEEFVAIVKGEAGMHDYVPVRIRSDGAITVELRGRTYAISQDWTFGGIRAGGSCNGRPFTAQIERDGMWTRVAHNGRRVEVMVLTRARGRTAAHDAVQGAGRHEQVPALADARHAGRRRRAAGAEGAGRRAARGDRGDEDGERPARDAGRHRDRAAGEAGRERGGGPADPEVRVMNAERAAARGRSGSSASSRSPSAGPTSSA